MRKSRYKPSTPSSYRPVLHEPSLREVLRKSNKQAWLYSNRAQTTEAADWLDIHEAEAMDARQKMWRSLFGWLILLPLAIMGFGALLVELLKASTAQSLWFSTPVWYSLMGVLIWIVLHFSKLFNAIFLYVYVLGHELTHYFAIRLSGGEVSDFKVSIEGGHVITDKNSLFIALSPYFIPLWGFVWLLLCAIIALFVSWQSMAGIMFAGVGFWWSFHFYWTLWVIPKDQPDLNDNGTMFSLMIIYLANLFFTVIGLTLCRALSPQDYLSGCWTHLKLFVDLLQYLFSKI